MNWDWEKLQKRRQGPGGGGGGGKPPFPDFGDGLNKLKNLKFPGGKILILVVLLIWAATGIYIVEPDEVGVVQRFGEYARMTGAGPHYHLPYPIETAKTPKVTQIRRVELGFRTIGEQQDGRYAMVPEESLMLTGDENIVDVQFIVQYQVSDPVAYLFNIKDPDITVKDAAEAAMREVIGYNKIDSALTTGKLEIQNHTMDLLQEILDRYESGIRINAVQLQDVHPPQEVIDAFKDVASAREDKSRIINESEAYRNDILPKARGQNATIVNAAEAYKESVVRQATGESARFNSILKEYNQAPNITETRLFIETMEQIFSNPDLGVTIISKDALDAAVPYLPLEKTPRAPKVQETPAARQSITKGGN